MRQFRLTIAICFAACGPGQASVPDGGDGGHGASTDAALPPFDGNRPDAGTITDCTGDPGPPTVPDGTLSISDGHPRLFWNADRLARARAWYPAHPFDPAADDPMANAFRYLMTGETSYARVAIDWALAFDPAGSMDQARWNGENAIVVYDWCYDQMSDAERSTLRARWDAAVVEFDGSSWGGPTMPENNYYWGYLRNSLEWGITSNGESAQAASFVDDALVTRWQGTFLPFADGGERGGVPIEGSQYGRYQLWYPIIPFVTATLDGRRLFDETEFFRAAIYYLVYASTPARTSISGGDAHYLVFPFGDDEMWLGGDSFNTPYYGDVLTALAGLWADQPVGQHARHLLATLQPDVSPYVQSADGGGSDADFSRLPLDYYAPGPSFLFTRNQWSSSATSIVAQMGFPVNSGHEHLDAGSFQIWRNGRWLSRETVGYTDMLAGYGGAQITTHESPAHNMVLFNGIGMANAYLDGDPHVVRLESRADYSFAAVDVSAAYRATASGYPDRDDNPFARTVIRELVFVRALETLVVFDRLESSSDSQTRDGWTGPQLAADAVTKTFALHFETQPTMEDATHVLGVNGDQALRVTMLAPAAPTTRLVSEGGAVGQVRLEIDATGSAQSYFLNVLQARDAAGANLDATVVEDASSFTVTLTPATGEPVVLVFATGMSSSGGSITIGNSAPTPLTSSVQSIRVSECGPIWGP